MYRVNGAAMGQDNKEDDKFRSYADYVSFLAKRNASYNWISDYFNSPEKLKGLGDERSDLWIFDSDGAKMQKRELGAANVLQHFQGVKTRVVILSCLHGQRHSLNILDRLAFELDLDPCFLWENLWSEEQSDPIYPGSMHGGTPYGQRDIRNGARARAARDELFFEVDGNQKISLKTMKFGENGEATLVFMMIKDAEDWVYPYFDYQSSIGPKSSSKQTPVIPFKLTTVSRHLADALPQISPEECQDIASRPINVIIPYLYQLLFAIGCLIQSKGGQVWELKLSDTIDHKITVLDHYNLFSKDVIGDLGSVVSDLKKIIAHDTMKENVTLAQIAAEILELKSELEALSRMVDSELAIIMGRLSLRESARSIEQTESSKRVSQLAYIYLPLAFSSSLFGMNIPQFENSNLTAFVVTSIVLLVVSLLLWMSFNPVRKLAGRVHEKAMEKKPFERILHSTRRRKTPTTGLAEKNGETA